MSEVRRPGQQPATRTQVRRPGGPGEEPTTIPFPTPEGFDARDGDVLVVAYPEVTLPLRVKYAVLKVGDCSYSRQLREGDDVNEQFVKISRWLSSQVEGDIKRKVTAYLAELEGQEKR